MPVFRTNPPPRSAAPSGPTGPSAPPTLPPAHQPEQALAAVVALRLMADRLEIKAVQAALDQGWSWSDIAQALGVSKQAAHRRLSDAVRV